MKLFVQLFLIVFFHSSSITNIKAQLTYVPDDNFEAYLETIHCGDGIINNHYVITDSIAKIETLDIHYKQIADLTGIEDFLNLRILRVTSNLLTELDLRSNSGLEELHCTSNELKSLNLSGNLELTTLVCNLNYLESLDVSNNNKLTDIACGNNQLKDLNLSNNKKLTRLDCFANNLSSLNLVLNVELSDIDCAANKLETLDVITNNKLERLACYENNLSVLILGSKPELRYLWCSKNNLITLDISKCDQLGYLHCDDNNIAELDLSNNNKLIEVYCNDNKIRELRTGNNSILSILHCEYNELEQLNTDQLRKLSELNCFRNKISNLGLYSNPALEYLNCRGNTIHNLDLTRNTILGYLNCRGNRLTNLELTSNIELYYLDCSFNDLINLDLSKNAKLGSLKCTDNVLCSINLKNGNNKIISLDAKDNPYLTCIQVDNIEWSSINWSKNVHWQVEFQESNCPDCHQLTYIPDSAFEAYIESKDWGDGILNNHFVSTHRLSFVSKLDIRSKQIFDLSGIEDFINLYILDCSYNLIDTLNLNKNRSLTEIQCQFNKIKELNVNEAVNLEYLNCVSNRLTNLDLSKNNKLKELNCGGNKLTQLDLSNPGELVKLSCNQNDLNTLDVSDNPNLLEIQCIWNQLSSLDVNGCTSLYYLLCNNNKLQSLDLSSNIKLETLICSTNNLCYINLRNGNNTKLKDPYFSNNPDLKCIQVDDVESSTKLWKDKDAQTKYTEKPCTECGVGDLKVYNIESGGISHELNILNLSIAADGSAVTQFEYEGEDAVNIELRFKEEQFSDPDLFGYFKDNGVNNSIKTVIYHHPTYISETGNLPYKKITLQVINEQSDEILLEYPINIVRPPLLLVHGIWSNPKDGFGAMEDRLINEGLYMPSQIYKVQYLGDQRNVLNLFDFIKEKEKLKKNVLLYNISSGKFDVIGHSNGGLLTRYYLQSKVYKDDINKVITFNTPHSGSQLASLIRNKNYSYIYEYYMDLLGIKNDPNLSIINDLKVDGEFIRELNSVFPGSNVYNNVAFHTFSSTKRVLEAEDIVVIDSWLELPYGLLYFHWKAANILLNKGVDKLFNNDQHDLVVALESQKAGSLATTNFQNQQHMGSTANLSMQDKAIELLNQDPNHPFYFTKKGLKPPLLAPSFNDAVQKSTNIVITEDSLIIRSPKTGSKFKSGQDVLVTVEGTSGISNIITALGNNSMIPKVYIDEDTNYVHHVFSIPEDVVGKLNIISTGYHAGGVADNEVSYIYVSTDALLLDLLIEEQDINVLETGKASITLTGYYDDGYNRNLSGLEDVEYKFKHGKAKLSAPGIIEGLSKGIDTLIVEYLNETAEIPIIITGLKEWEGIVSGMDNISIEQQGLFSENIIIYPNPTNKVLYISTSVPILTMEVYDILGSKVLDLQQFKNQINIESLTNGVYLIKFNDEKWSAVKRFIVN